MIAEEGVSYVGVSIDGVEATHDRFRNERGAFRKALEGLKNARDSGIKTGIRFTVNRHNFSDLPAVTDLLIKHQIPRFCLYHLVYAGRATAEMDITNDMRVEMVGYLIQRTKTLANHGIEVFTTDSHADGIYILNSVESAEKSNYETADNGIIRCLHRGLAIESRPFLTPAQELGTTEDELLEVIRSLIAIGFIRRYGAVVRHERVGYSSNVLVAWKIPERRIGEFEAVIRDLTEVSHGYERVSYPEWRYNVYTMSTAIQKTSALAWWSVSPAPLR